MDNRTYNLGIPWILRILFVNITKLMYLLSKNVIKKKKKLDITYLPELEEKEKVENQYWLMEQVLDRICNGRPVTGRDVFRMVKYIFRR